MNSTLLKCTEDTATGEGDVGGDGDVGVVTTDESDGSSSVSTLT